MKNKNTGFPYVYSLCSFVNKGTSVFLACSSLFEEFNLTFFFLHVIKNNHKTLTLCCNTSKINNDL